MPDVSMKHYNIFLSALLDQAIRDAGSPKLELRRATWRWLRADPDCVEI